MSGPCLCGDIYCGSCGPAQGNYKCPACGRWTADGGCKNPRACEDIMEKTYDDEREDEYAEED